ncbi:MAG: PorP/SprF family type IX secretion system membrane protein [Bacteroidetes bacterium]|jgi:type IX secretion system PorP/SprF family membrane protein|nr:PorP/SprF family type IX secretion system membrane protein [Bacteroidota bacterium]
MKRIINISLLLIMIAGPAAAQQLMTSSLFDQHGNLHNPATAGSSKHGVIGVSYRKMWDGIDGGPQTTLAFGSAYLSKLKVGIGGYVYNDVTGPTKRTGIQTSYAYHIPLNDGNASFSLGIEARFQQFAIDKAKLAVSLGNDPVLAGADSRFKGDAGFGIAYTGKKLQIGASVSQLIQTKLDFYTGTLNRNEEARLYRHYYLHGNYSWDVDGSTKIIPNFLFIYLPNAPLEFQGGARVEHKDVFWWGLALRARQSWMISAGVKIQKKFTLGYSFDIFNTPLSVYDRGSNGHELLLRYDFLK